MPGNRPRGHSRCCHQEAGLDTIVEIEEWPDQGGSFTSDEIVARLPDDKDDSLHAEVSDANWNPSILLD